jgi:hypothetical protein
VITINPPIRDVTAETVAGCKDPWRHQIKIRVVPWKIWNRYATPTEPYMAKLKVNFGHREFFS